MPWDFDANRPIYTQLTERLRLRIASGEYPPGGKLPAVRELAAEAGANPNTVQRAFADLEREGLIYGNATDAGALANYILQVLQSPDGGAALGQAARARALQTHDPRTNALTLWKIYADILGQQP